jgi:hypothetical protein
MLVSVHPRPGDGGHQAIYIYIVLTNYNFYVPFHWTRRTMQGYLLLRGLYSLWPSYTVWGFRQSPSSSVSCGTCVLAPSSVKTMETDGFAVWTRDDNMLLNKSSSSAKEVSNLLMSTRREQLYHSHVDCWVVSQTFYLWLQRSQRSFFWPPMKTCLFQIAGRSSLVAHTAAETLQSWVCTGYAA